MLLSSPLKKAVKFTEADESVQDIKDLDATAILNAEALREVNDSVEDMDLDELMKQAHLHNLMDDQELEEL